MTVLMVLIGCITLTVDSSDKMPQSFGMNSAGRRATFVNNCI